MRQKKVVIIKPELFVFIIFIVIYISITTFHEPWFDEAQAWQIGKCATIKEMLFEIPHYEGHPPLWHLLLSIIAKLGVPFEFGLKTIGFVLSTSSAGIILFRSRLPKFARLLLPFSYFFFYQNAIIVRPYGLMFVAMLLLGIEYHNRKAHPWRVVGLLSLLCFTSAYGIVFAGGIAICILWDIIQEKRLCGVLKELLKDPRTLSLLLLLLLAIILVVEIFPRPNTYSPVIVGKNSFFICLLCTILTLPAECFLTTGSWFSIDRTLLQNVFISKYELALFCFIGIVVWFLLICISSRKNLKLLLVPYTLFSLFAAKVYFSGHHLVSVFIFLLFWFEVECQDNHVFEIGHLLSERIVKTESDKKLIQYLYIGLGLVSLLIPIYWTSAATYHDIVSDYSFGRNVASFIKNKGMEDCLILADWSVSGSLFPQSEGKVDYVNPYMCGTGTELSAYFSHNMALNLNDGIDHKAYSIHKLGTYEESEEAKGRWRGKGKPDLIVGHPDLEQVYDSNLNYSEYSLVMLDYTNYIWKAGYTYASTPLFLRNDLVNQFDVEPITGIELMVLNGLIITEDMKEQYNNGVPVEDIIKPYLDAMFGEK